ncbi:unnamed protein product [Schistosoma curassoni]|uniref:LRP2-binding protein n=1 Tax=Schistosoma curassoni TaxID=6186 RepID=A0A183JC92_9TREM|nr:unnamed protein product [Schistosoma curassoni]
MELLNGLPKSIRHEDIKFLSSKTVENAISNGTLESVRIFNRHLVSENLETLLKKWLDEGDEQCAFYLGQIYFEKAKACEFFKEIMTLNVQLALPVDERNLVFSAAFNLGRAYYQGYGVCPSTEDALRCFLFAANNGDSKACISAQTAVGYLYSGPEIRDLQKAFQWHSDACGNGSVESQGQCRIY